jgi:hypothetical protein
VEQVHEEVLDQVHREADGLVAVALTSRKWRNR